MFTTKNTSPLRLDEINYFLTWWWIAFSACVVLSVGCLLLGLQTTNADETFFLDLTGVWMGALGALVAILRIMHLTRDRKKIVEKHSWIDHSIKQ